MFPGTGSSRLVIELSTDKATPEMLAIIMGAPQEGSDLPALLQWGRDQEYLRFLDAMRQAEEDPEKRGVLVLVDRWSTAYYLSPDIPSGEAVCELAYVDLRRFPGGG